MQSLKFFPDREIATYLVPWHSINEYTGASHGYRRNPTSPTSFNLLRVGNIETRRTDMGNLMWSMSDRQAAHAVSSQ